MLKPSSLAKWGVAVLLISSLSSCEDILEQYFPKPTPTPPTVPTFPPLGQDIAFYALSGGNKLDAFSTANAATRISSVSITGLQNGETLLAIDFRPATGQLYGVSSASRLYVINQNTGAARAIGAGTFTPAVAGNLVGFDFNPTVDRIRLVTSTGQNLRLNPETGMVAATDGVLNGAAGATITGAAYTNNVAGATTTVLYDLDPATDQLYRQDPPNDGTLISVGSLNLNISGDGGFDIDARTGTALGLYSVNGNPTLFAVDLNTGAARPLAQYAANAGYTGIAIPTRPVAYALLTQTNSARTNYYALVIFDPTDPTVTTNKLITGSDIADFEVLVSLDFRPANGQLYATSHVGFLYTINIGTGVATRVVPTRSNIGFEPFESGFDFNPVTDRIRLAISADQNVEINPTTNVATRAANLTPGIQTIVGAAHDNNYAGATSSTLYLINQDNSSTPRLTLFRESTPNSGTVVPIGGLGLTPTFFTYTQFDIGGMSNTAYALIGQFPISGKNLYTINLTTGAATAVSTVEFNVPLFNNSRVRGLAVGLGF